MSKPKRVFAVLLTVTLALTLLAFPLCAFADDLPEWVRITDDDTAFYTNAARTKITCYLEKSYYVKVLSRSGDFLKAELMDNSEGFPKIIGYVAANRVEFCDETPLTPTYPQKSVVVSANSAKIYFSPLTSSEILIVATNTHKMSYYGSIEKNGSLWYYVYYNDMFGYVESLNVTSPNVALHPTPLTKPTVTEPAITPQEPSEPEGMQTSVGEILLIVFVMLLAIGLTLTLFIPSNNKQRGDYGIDKRIR